MQTKEDISVQQIAKVSSQLIELDDPFILKLIKQDNLNEIKALEQKYNVIIQISEGFGQIQILPNEDNIDEHLDESIITEIQQHIAKFEKNSKKKLNDQFLECNRDFYKKLDKLLKTNYQHLQPYQLNFIGNESQMDYDQTKIYYPLVVKSVEVQDKFLIQICKIEQPEYLNFEEIDVLVLNMTNTGLFVDEFGYSLANANPSLHQLLKELKQDIKNSSFIDEKTFRQGRKTVNLLIQLKDDEQACIDNLKFILDKLKDQKFKQKGHLRIAISLRECCGKEYISQFSQYMQAIYKQKSFLNYPTEISFIVNDRTENLISQQLEKFKQKFVQQKEKLGLLSLFSQKSKTSDREERIREEEQQQSLLCIRGSDSIVGQIKQIFTELKQKKFITYQIPLTNGSLSDELVKYLKELAVKQTIDIQITENHVTLYAYKKTINKFLPLVSNQIKSTQNMLRIQCQVPPHWEDQKENLKIVDLDIKSAEAQQCIDLMNKTIKPRVLKVKRIQNIKLWRNYQFEKEKLILKGNATEKLLFHGTRNNKPDLIYSGTEEGFDFRLSAHGMYGRGTYFHETASYSDGYAYVSGTTKIFFVAQVLVGNFYVGGSSGYVAPPVVPGTNGIRFDSIRSNYNEGNNMFIIYHNSKAYPTYLIEYTYS